MRKKVTFTIPIELYRRMQVLTEWFGDADFTEERFERELERTIEGAEDIMREQRAQAEREQDD